MNDGENMGLFTVWILRIAIFIVPLIIAVLVTVLLVKKPSQNKVFGYRIKKTLSCEKNMEVYEQIMGEICNIIWSNNIYFVNTDCVLHNS